MTHDRRAGINDWERAHTYLLSKARSIACVAPSLKYCLLLNKNKLVSNFYQFINHLKTVETARAYHLNFFSKKPSKQPLKWTAFCNSIANLQRFLPIPFSALMTNTYWLKAHWPKVMYYILNLRIRPCFKSCFHMNLNGNLSIIGLRFFMNWCMYLMSKAP